MSESLPSGLQVVGLESSKKSRNLTLRRMMTTSLLLTVQVWRTVVLHLFGNGHPYPIHPAVLPKSVNLPSWVPVIVSIVSPKESNIREPA